MTEIPEHDRQQNWTVVSEYPSNGGNAETGTSDNGIGASLDFVVRLAADLIDVPLVRIVIPSGQHVGGSRRTAGAADPPLEDAFGPAIMRTAKGDIYAATLATTDVAGWSIDMPKRHDGMRFVLGVPLFVGDERAGILLVADKRPRAGLSESQADRLQELGALTASLLSARKDLEKQRRVAESARLLQLELNHRVRNTMAVLQSIAGQTLSANIDPQVFITTFTGRMRAMAEAHALLSESEWGAVQLRVLILRLVLPYAPDSRQFQCAGEDVEVPPDQALGLSFALHELATNAAVHGAFSSPGGSVAVTWEIAHNDGSILKLKWKESGGPAVTAPPPDKFGTILIRHSLDKTPGSAVSVEFPKDGVCAAFSVPL